MSSRTKNSIYTIIILIAMLAVWWYRSSHTTLPENATRVWGETMGTSYSLILFDADEELIKNKVDSLLEVFNRSLNTWLPTSEISMFNKGDSLSFRLPFLYPVLKSSEKIYLKSEGAFDPTVMPLVNAWGFGPDQEVLPDSAHVDSLLNLIGFNRIGFDRSSVWKEDPRLQLDFSAIAKGYGVDVVSEYLADLGFTDHFVEIGGEVRVMGINRISGAPWTVGITDPRSKLGSTELFAILKVSDAAVATSGNYYNYIIRDGKRYSHTIDPYTGYPVERNILSATVVTGNCMDADGLATAFMVMGHEKAIDIIERDRDIDAFIIFTDKNGGMNYFTSQGIIDMIEILE